MKRNALLLALAVLAGSATAQSLRTASNRERSAINPGAQPVKVDARMDAASNLRTPVGPRAVQAIPGSDWAAQVGYTFFDLQTYGSNSNLIQNFGDNNLSVTWMYGRGAQRGGRMAGYNHYSASLSRWLHQAGINNPGSTEDSLNYNSWPRTPTTAAGGGLATGRIGWPNLITSANKEAIASYAFYPTDPGALSRIQVRQPSAGAQYGAVFGPPDVTRFDTLRGELDKEALFHIAATDGVNSYIVTTSEDTEHNPNLLAGGTVNNLIVYRTTDAGSNWSKLYIDKISAANGIGGVKGIGYAIDCRGSEVAVVAQVMTARPDNGVATYLFRSSDFGATWRSKLIQKRTTADTSFRVGANFCLATDGSFSVVIDRNNKAHVTSHAGYQTLDSAGTATGTFYINGGFSNLAASGLYYFNEDMPDNADFRELTGLVDVNKDGNLTIPGSTATGRPGLYPVCGISMSTASTGPNGELYITYSALVEGTELTSNTRVTRDIYVMASYDNGLTWTNPINVAGRLVIDNGFTYDDGSSGSGLYEEAWPVAVKRVGADNRLHIFFMSDDIAGLAEAGTSFSALNQWAVWVGNQMNHIAIPIANIEGSFLKATFPAQVCAGATFTQNVAAPSNVLPIYGNLDANSVFTLELDTTNTGAFARPVVLGTFSGNAAGGAINATVPANIPTGVYKIRVRVNNGNAAATPPVYESASSVYDIVVTTGAPATPGAITNLTSTGQSIPANGTICATTSAMFNIPSIGNAAEYEWSVSPATAGSIQINGDRSQGGNFSLATFNASATGTVTVSVVAKNGCGTSAASTFSFNVGGGTATLDAAAGTATASSSGGAWEYSSQITGPFVPLSTPVTSNVLNLRANPTNTPEGNFYRYNAGGCATNAVFLAVTSLNSTVLANSVKVYPNPASTQFTIGFNELAGAANVEVYNATGALVKSAAADASVGATTLSTAGMNKGMYFVRITNGGASTVKRLVIE